MSLEAAIAREVHNYDHYCIELAESQQQTPTSQPQFEPQTRPRATHANESDPQPLKHRPKAAAPRCGVRAPTHQLVEQILQTVGELENTLIEDRQHDFDLQMAFDRQTEKLRDLRTSLETERERNERLMELIRGVDSCSSAEEDTENFLSRGASSQWQSRSSMDAYESISPLLMQQRYDELSLSHKQCRRQLVRKEKLLTMNKCEKEELQARYDQLFDEYRNEQKRFEDLCCKYLRLQAKKNQEIQRLRDALTLASDCVLNAQEILEQFDQSPHNDYSDEHSYNSDHTKDIEAFRQNLQSFVRSLKLCRWVQSSRHKATAK